jgi:hypothetical protein
MAGQPPAHLWCCGRIDATLKVGSCDCAGDEGDTHKQKHHRVDSHVHDASCDL